MVLEEAFVGFYLSPGTLGNEVGPYAAHRIALLILACTLPLPPCVSLVQQVSNMNKHPSVLRKLGALQAALREISSQGSEPLTQSVSEMKTRGGGNSGRGSLGCGGIFLTLL